jgi:anion-transporting  ArsA/GET3 family ATPase
MKIRIFVGTGGVGKTSVTAASALRSALDGKKSLVLTIDPAWRLRSALGLTGTALEQRVGLEAIDGKGELWAALLDVPSAMNRMVEAHVSRDAAREIIAHPVYRLMLTSLAGMNELLAVERIGQAMADGFENLFIDTAPSRHAFEFLDKPEFFVQLVSFPLIRLVGRTFGLWRKGRSAPSDTGSKGGDGDIYGKVEQLIGAALAGQILEFFSIFQPVAEGYASSARDTIGVLRESGSTAFTIVSSPARARQDGNYFFTELTKRGYSVEQLIVNRLWPEWDMKSAPGASEATRELVGWYENVCAAQRAGRDKAAAAWHGKGPRVIDLPELARNVDGIAALASIAEHLRHW